MNTAYSILTYNYDTSGYYDKAKAFVMLSETANDLLLHFMQYVPADRVAEFACILCYEVLYTSYGKEILTIDTCNTYSAQTGVNNGNICPIMTYVPKVREVSKYLDKDILDRLVVPSPLDIAGACILQLLRKAVV